MAQLEHSSRGDDYPAHYGIVTPDEVLALHAIVVGLGGVVRFVSFHLTPDNVLPFAVGAVSQFDPDTAIDKAAAVNVFREFALEQSGAGRLAVVLHGPDRRQLAEIAFQAEVEAMVGGATL